MNATGRTKHFLDILASIAERDNQPLYLVGGSVRDSLLGKTSVDYDFTVSNATHLARHFARDIQCPFVALDDTPGRETFRVVIDRNLYFDFSQMQGKTLAEDLSRRDFTINALAVPIQDFLAGSNNIIDPHRGIEDLRNGIIRVLPGEIFSDDPLRMVRAFRFASTLKFSIEPNTLANIIACKSQIKRVASERIYYELSLLLGSTSVYPLLVSMEETGLLGQLFPEIQHIQQTLLIFELLESMENSPCLFGNMFKPLNEKQRSTLKLATILHDIPDASSALKRLRASNAEITVIDKTLKGRDEALSGFEAFRQNNESKIYRFTKQCGNELIPALLLAQADYCARNHLCATSSNPFADAVMKVYDFNVRRYLPSQEQPALLNGDDLIDQFNIAPSPRFKTILETIEENRVLGIIKTRKEAESLAKDLIENP